MRSERVYGDVLLIVTWLVLAAASCGSEREPEGISRAEAPAGPPGDPIAVRMGEREVRVRCAMERAALEDELSGLHAVCVHDPTSTPHHVSVDRSMISLGCCTQTRAAYERACGLEGAAGPRVSAWGARCESGRLESGGT